MNKGFVKKSQLWLTLVGLGLLAMLLLAKRDALGDTVETLKNANLVWVLMLPLLQAVNFLALAYYYQSMLRLFGASLGVGHLWKVVAALTFVNQILPSGGMSGIAYVIYGFRRKVSAGVASLIQLGRYVLSLSAYFLMAPLVILLAWLDGQSEWLRDTFDKAMHSPKALGVIIGFAIIALTALFVLTSKKTLKRFGGKIEKLINRVVRMLKRDKGRKLKAGSVEGAIGDFSQGIDFFKKQGRKTFRPLGFMLLNSFFELAIVFAAFQAVGGEVGIGVLFISFIASNIAGVVSIIPGDIGVNESVMILMLSGLGIDDSIAISATLLYRIFNKFIFLGIGFFFFSRLLRPEAAKQA